MFKGFQSTSRGFNGIPNLNFQMNNQAYGFSGCTFWLDAAYGLNTQTDLAAVSSWQARIGNAIFTQATAGNQPQLILSDANFNNLPVINCQDSNRRLVNSLGTLNWNEKNTTIAVVAKNNSISNVAVIFGNSTSNSRYFCYGGTGGTISGIGISDGSGNNIFNSNIENTSTHISVLNGTELVIDGVSVKTGSWTNSLGIDSIGSALNSSGFNLNGRISEIIFYNRVFSSGELIKLSDTLNSKYAIY